MEEGAGALLQQLMSISDLELEIGRLGGAPAAAARKLLKRPAPRSTLARGAAADGASEARILEALASVREGEASLCKWFPLPTAPFAPDVTFDSRCHIYITSHASPAALSQRNFEFSLTLSF